MQLIARLPHIGLPSGYSNVPAPTTTIACKVVELPYMGPSPRDDMAHAPYPTEEVRYKRYAQREELHQAVRPDEFSDPAELFDRKVANVARLLGCTEREAERVIFGRM